MYMYINDNSSNNDDDIRLCFPTVSLMYRACTHIGAVFTESVIVST